MITEELKISPLKKVMRSIAQLEMMRSICPVQAVWAENRRSWRLLTNLADTWKYSTERGNSSGLGSHCKKGFGVLEGVQRRATEMGKSLDLRKRGSGKTLPPFITP